MVTGLPECDRCHRPAKRRALYYRLNDGRALLAGRYGKKCFYAVARIVVRGGNQPEHEDARIVHVRSRRS